MPSRLGLIPLFTLSMIGVAAHAQTSKYLPGDTLLVPAATQVDVIGGEGFVTGVLVRARVVGKKYPYWFVDFDLSNDVVDSTRVGNSFLLKPGVVNESLQDRDQGLEHNRKLSRMGVDVEKAGGRVEQVIEALAADGVPVLLKFSFETNPEGGVEPKVRIYNISDRRIRAVGVDFRGVDEHGELVPCTRSGATAHSVRLNGPIDPDAECYYAFVNDPAFFSEEAACLEIDSITVEFMDGESLVLDEDLAKIQDLLRSPFMRPGGCPG